MPTTISIHAPTKGATNDNVWCDKVLPYFNPRSHEGSDSFLEPFHAVFHNFNPRSHEGSDWQEADSW